MPSQHDPYMPVDGQMSVEIEAVKSSAMNKFKTDQGWAELKNLHSFLFNSFETLDSEMLFFERL